ncbi:unnamed protein product [Vitrella brassicaformis CCMP3155]|uniref:Uncharacterized protein n=1 Tax=Vitrella brassicaformis (strain CCMP3155) TaxID=1169540 RepID=A0A0G4GAU5_VITBC|nr:unnamed protein product [Vitrella brassicaformis CCMP3155]|eukprot:CEM25923.1 unnamed protein product [Vitrella brassicaformis CCMP3155]
MPDDGVRDWSVLALRRVLACGGRPNLTPANTNTFAGPRSCWATSRGVRTSERCSDSGGSILGVGVVISENIQPERHVVSQLRGDLVLCRRLLEWHKQQTSGVHPLTYPDFLPASFAHLMVDRLATTTASSSSWALCWKKYPQLPRVQPPKLSSSSPARMLDEREQSDDEIVAACGCTDHALQRGLGSANLRYTERVVDST